jgi:hypothetical protein
MLEDVMATYDVDENEAQEIYDEIVGGALSIEDFIESAAENDIYFDWDWLDEDDWWTDRKGGYDVTYEVIHEDPVEDDLLKRLKDLKAEFDKLVADEKDKQ